MMRRLLLTLALVTFAFPATAQQPKKVIASFSILADIVRQIGGDQLSVTTLVPAMGDAHIFQPAPSDARALAQADIGIATEGLSRFEELVSFPCYQWNHEIVVPQGHPLTRLASVSLADLAAYPLITYDVGFTGRSHIDDAFGTAGLGTDIVLTAMDSDVIQQYVALGLGVGLVASMAVQHNLAAGLQPIGAAHLFAPNVARMAVRRGAYLRSYTYDFILKFAPELRRADIEAALSSGGY